MSAGLKTADPTERILPTVWKDQVGIDWSYAVGAAKVSAALVDLPQWDRLSLRFRYASQGVLQGRNPIDVGFAHYRQAGASIYRKRDDPRVGVPEWTLTIVAVPRPLRSAIHLLLAEEGLATVRAWLVDMGRHEGREGVAGLRLTYDDQDERLVARRHEKLLPRRAP